MNDSNASDERVWEYRKAMKELLDALDGLEGGANYPHSCSTMPTVLGEPISFWARVKQVLEEANLMDELRERFATHATQTLQDPVR